MFENVEFNIVPEQLIFKTQVDGDRLTISHIEFTAEQAAAMAYLINQPAALKVEIKVVE